MERDPLRLVWRAAPGLTVALVVLALVAGLPLVLVVLEFVRAAIDAAAVGARQGTATLLRWTIVLPERLADAPIVVLPGFAMPRRALPFSMAIGLGSLLAAATLMWWIAGTLAARIGRRVRDLLVERVSEGIASAPVGAAEEARHAAALGVEAIGRDRRALGFLPALPVFTGAALIASVGWVVLRDIESGLALLLALCAFAYVSSRQSRLRRRLAEAERAVASGLLGALADLARNLPAVARHGTQATESRRIAETLAAAEQRADSVEAKALAGEAATALLTLAGPLAVLAASLWASRADALGPGDAASSVVAAIVAIGALFALRSARRVQVETGPLFAELGRILGGFQSRRRGREAPPLPTGGILDAVDVATAPSPDGRLSGTSFSFTLPAHVALTGPRGGGARSAAALIGGQIGPSRGKLTLDGADLAAADAAWHARHLAFAGGETWLFAGSLRANLAYGAPEAEDLDHRLHEAVEAAGLEPLVERRGLFGKVDPRREPDLADRLLAARAELSGRLGERGLSGLVAPFDPERYNPHATIGENLLFGAAIGDTFRDERLPSQPFMRSLLDAEGLTKPLAAMGAEIARVTLEMFADLPDGPSVVGGYSLVSLDDREEMERVLTRRAGGQRGTASTRDAERLVGLAMHYSEPKHRLGLLDEEMQARLVRVRTQFAERLPKSLEPAVEFFAADRICAAASVRDNLLFGRIVQGRANAERDVMRETRTVLDGFGLAADIARIGLLGRLDPVDHGMSSSEMAAVEVVRCLVRSPDNLVIEHALDHLPESEALETARRLGRAMAGKGLVIALPEAVAVRAEGLFGEVIRFESGRAAEDRETISKGTGATLSGSAPQPATAGAPSGSELRDG
jgi:ABC-type multidrug transport system fused ATPase/permease subunit